MFVALIPIVKAAIATYGVTTAVGASIDTAVYYATEDNPSLSGAAKAAGTGALTALATAGVGNALSGAAKAVKVAKAVTKTATVAQKVTTVSKVAKVANAAATAVKEIAKQSAGGATGGAVRAMCSNERSFESVAKGALKGGVGGICSSLVPIDEADSALKVITKSSVAGAVGSGSVQVVDNALNEKPLNTGMKEALTQGAIIGGANGVINVAIRKYNTEGEKGEEQETNRTAASQKKESPKQGENIFEGCISEGNLEDGMVIRNSDNVRVINHQSNRNGKNGIRIENSKGVKITNSECNDNGSAGISLKSVTDIEFANIRIRFRGGHRMEITHASAECPFNTHLKIGANAKLDATIRRLQEAYKIGSAHRAELGLSDHAFTDLTEIMRNPAFLNAPATCKQFAHVHPKAVANLRRNLGTVPNEVRGCGIQGSGILGVKDNNCVTVNTPKGTAQTMHTVRLEGILPARTTAYSLLADLSHYGEMQGSHMRSWLNAQSELLSATFRSGTNLNNLNSVVQTQVNNLMNLRSGEYRILPSGFQACAGGDAPGHALYMLVQARNGALFPEIHNCGARNYSVPIISSWFGFYPEWHVQANNNVHPYGLSPLNQNNRTSLHALVDVTMRAYHRPVVCDHGDHVSQMANMALVYSVRNPSSHEIPFSYPNQVIGNCASHGLESIRYRVLGRENADLSMQWHREWIAKLKEEQTSA